MSAAWNILDEIRIKSVKTWQRHLERTIFFCVSLQIQIISSMTRLGFAYDVKNCFVPWSQAIVYKLCVVYLRANLWTALHLLNSEFYKNLNQQVKKNQLLFLFYCMNQKQIAYKSTHNCIKKWSIYQQLMNNMPCNDDEDDTELSVSSVGLKLFWSRSSFQSTALCIEFLSSLRRMTQAALRWNFGFRSDHPTFSAIVYFASEVVSETNGFYEHFITSRRTNNSCVIND